MAEIIPRWEWRTFGQEFGEAENNIKKHKEGGFKESEEKYILSKMSGNNIKIRDDLADVKTQLNVNADKLEQWTVAMKQSFPAPKDKLEELFRDYFKVPLPAFKRDTYTYTEFLNELVASCGELCIVEVLKKRQAYEINGTTVEIAETKFNGVPMRTVCVEHADPALVISTVRELGLAGLENINYINAMKTAVGMAKG
jgi:exopolyphosphatase/guanosine-5'-triphosphate,3'-diphosphate pyrophosphatase